MRFVLGENLRREPFRFFFPLGLAIATAGVAPWLAFGRGWIHDWPAVPHALSMMQGFLLALAAGFLGTMIPRRTGTAPMSAACLVVIALGLAVGTAALLAGATAWGEAAFLIALLALAGFLAARFRARTSAVAPPASFVFIPFAVAHGVIGALVLLSTDAPAAMLLGRSLVGQGVLFALAMAVAPMLVPIIVEGKPPGETVQRGIVVHVIVAIAFSASFACEAWLSAPAGLGLRGALLVLELSLAGVWSPGTRAGLHRSLFRASLILLPIGVLAAALVPAQRVTLLHVSFIGGLGLLALATSVHVTVSHTGRGELADRRPWPVAVAAALLLGGALVRVSLARAGADIFEALSLAALLWLLAVVTWAAFLIPLVVRRGPR